MIGADIPSDGRFAEDQSQMPCTVTAINLLYRYRTESSSIHANNFRLVAAPYRFMLSLPLVDNSWLGSLVGVLGLTMRC